MRRPIGHVREARATGAEERASAVEVEVGAFVFDGVPRSHHARVTSAFEARLVALLADMPATPRIVGDISLPPFTAGITPEGMGHAVAEAVGRALQAPPGEANGTARLDADPGAIAHSMGGPR